MKQRSKQYINSISAELASLGFVSEREFEGKEVYRWLKPAHEGSFYFIRLMEATSADYPQAVSCALGLTSEYMTNVFNRLKIRECYKTRLSFSPQMGEETSAMDVFSVPLHWILLNEPEPVMTLVWPAMVTTATANAKALIRDIQVYAMPVLEKVDTVDKLVSFLVDIDDYPCREGLTKGPKSPNQYIYTAMYLLKLGKAAAAMKELNTGYKIELAKINRMWAGDDELPATLAQLECIYEKFRKEIEKQL